jgi:pyruvate kinase
LTARRVALYRGVFPVEFEVDQSSPRSLYQDIFNALLAGGHVEEGDLVIFTGDLDGVEGSTNAMKVVTVRAQQ